MWAFNILTPPMEIQVSVGFQYTNGQLHYLAALGLAGGSRGN